MSVLLESQGQLMNENATLKGIVVAIVYTFI